MGLETERKLFESGGRRPRAIAITLPKGWLRYWGLRKGQKVVVLCNSIIVVIPPGHPKADETKRFVKEMLLNVP